MSTTRLTPAGDIVAPLSQQRAQEGNRRPERRCACSVGHAAWVVIATERGLSAPTRKVRAWCLACCAVWTDAEGELAKVLGPERARGEGTDALERMERFG